MKIKRTTFGIATSHVISSSLLFPLLWLIIGLLFKPFILSKGYVPESVVTLVYYGVMLGAFYLGIKYSLSYINRKVLVIFPKKSAKHSITLFFMLIFLTHYGFYYFTEEISFSRVVFTIFLFLLFVDLTQKYFNSLGESDYRECTFTGQVLVTFSNLSVLIALFGMFALTQRLTSVNIVTYVAPILILMGISFGNLFPEPFYEKNAEKPIKKATILLVISLLVNIVLFLVYTYFSSLRVGI